MRRLSGLTPKDFDREWVNLMVKNHEDAVKQFEHCAKSKDEGVRKLAEDALPKVRDHLKEAKSLQDKLSGKSNDKNNDKKDNDKKDNDKKDNNKK
jgi:putative membrane protein